MSADPHAPRFVVHHHTGHGDDHHDLMLEQSGVLWTWQVNRPPAEWGEAPEPARRIADHRIAYLEYEGPISRGRGQCRIVDRGGFRLLGRSDDQLTLELDGQTARGRFELRLVDASRQQWQLRRLGQGE